MLEIAQTRETTEPQVKEMARGSTGSTGSTGSAVYAICSGSGTQTQCKTYTRGKHSKPHAAKYQTEVLNCSRCGAKGHTGDECRSTRDKKCHKCGMRGHFIKMCRNNSQTIRRSVPFTERRNVPVNYIAESGSDSDYAFMIEPHSGRITVIVAEEPIDMLIGSGASCNIINSSVAAKLRERGELFETCYRQIHPYGSKPIVARSCVTCDVRIGDRSARTEFVAIAGDSLPLLGKATAELLGTLHVGVNAVVLTSGHHRTIPGYRKGYRHTKKRRSDAPHRQVRDTGCSETQSCAISSA